MEINQRTRVEDLLNECPKMAEFFAQRGMYCLRCKGRVNCTLRKIAYYYGRLPVEDWVEEVRRFFEANCKKPKVVKAPSQSV